MHSRSRVYPNYPVPRTVPERLGFSPRSLRPPLLSSTSRNPRTACFLPNSSAPGSLLRFLPTTLAHGSLLRFLPKTSAHGSLPRFLPNTSAHGHFSASCRTLRLTVHCPDSCRTLRLTVTSPLLAVLFGSRFTAPILAEHFGSRSLLRFLPNSSAHGSLPRFLPTTSAHGFRFPLSLNVPVCPALNLFTFFPPASLLRYASPDCPTVGAVTPYPNNLSWVVDSQGSLTATASVAQNRTETQPQKRLTGGSASPPCNSTLY
ncbi:hypothetical protein OUZ56_033336 [Daphnia magna]|uniref:Uncharacterized protein n=1 Tax=Daphnia magna TaxID=35525 RepID=A0ABR0BAN0_9CRUS|nr:hypothetical protein OUZ56_033336 [Daphnia magna]